MRNDRQMGSKGALYTVTLSTVARFWSKVDKTSSPHGCWLWTASLFGDGYGRFNFGGVVTNAHVVAWVLVNGSVPAGKELCHNCPCTENNKRCVNMAHLYVGTHADNMRDVRLRKEIKNLARGDASPMRKHPELALRMRGDNNPARLHPECLRRGEGCRTALLTADKVRVIRKRYAKGDVLMDALAYDFGVRKNTISAVVRRETWKHIL